MNLAIIENKRALKEICDACRKKGQTIALVPTMGALHSGHLALVKQAKSMADIVVVSIFVNPAQFGPNEDFSQYPRTAKQDIDALKTVDADILYMPEVSDIYPTDSLTSIHVKGVSHGLCGAARPGHFDGVALVVTKLLLRVLPDVAIFGEKDYQQLAVIRQFVKDLDIPVSIVGAPIVRETDGLAMSSRNRYLNEAQRALAPTLYRILQDTAAYIKQHPYNVDNALSLAVYNLTHHGFDKVDYVELRSADTLSVLKSLQAPARLLAAAWIGKTRLIDNVEVPFS